MWKPGPVICYLTHNSLYLLRNTDNQDNMYEIEHENDMNKFIILYTIQKNNLERYNKYFIYMLKINDQDAIQ